MVLRKLSLISLQRHCASDFIIYFSFLFFFLSFTLSLELGRLDALSYFILFLYFLLIYLNIFNHNIILFIFMMNEEGFFITDID